MRGDGEGVPAVAAPDEVFRDAAGLVAGLRHGPYGGAATESAAELASETLRYLNYAGMRGGVTEPATVAAVLAHLCTAVYRVPQLLNLLGDWLAAEAAAGRLADDDGRPGWQLAESARSVLGAATEDADALARCLGAAQSLTATFRAADPAARPGVR